MFAWIGAHTAVTIALVGLFSSTLGLAGETKPYDYVIVGAGAAGSVVANRLSENSDVTVLVLEAGGPDDDERIYRPTSFRQLIKSPFDWAYVTEPEPHLNLREISWPRGKGWGGSGSITAMVYVRGHPRDFDRWKELGNPGWGFDDVLPYFIKAENQERGPSKFHGVGGPQNVADPRWVPPISLAFLKAAQESGLPKNEDFNGERQEGAGFYQLNQKNGERHSAAAAYLRPALRRENLTIRNHALVTQIVFEDRRAVGVKYSSDQTEQEVRATREVILCAGAIGSPQLLMLSGVGPAEHLKSLDIEVLHDLPGVGDNLQDHPRAAVTYESKKPLGFDQESAALEYNASRSGPLSSNGIGAGAFVKTSEEAAVPDIQIFLTASPRDTFSIHAALMRPQSRGRIRLRSNNITDAPLIQAHYLQDERDLDGLVRGLEVARRVAGAEALQSFRGEELSPGVAVDNAGGMRDHIRATSTTFFHAVGTCKMGTDPMSVVDGELRVRGLVGLRVIDASIMPTLISGATHAATVMIAEKGADLIKKTW